MGLSNLTNIWNLCQSVHMNWACLRSLEETRILKTGTRYLGKFIDVFVEIFLNLNIFITILAITII